MYHSTLYHSPRHYDKSFHANILRVEETFKKPITGNFLQIEFLVNR